MSVFVRKKVCSSSFFQVMPLAAPSLLQTGLTGAAFSLPLSDDPVTFLKRVYFASSLVAHHHDFCHQELCRSRFDCPTNEQKGYNQKNQCIRYERERQKEREREREVQGNFEEICRFVSVASVVESVVADLGEAILASSKSTK